MKIWKYYPEECIRCGSNVEVFTFEETEEGFVYDGDPIRCTECEEKGSMTVTDEETYILWNDEPEEVYASRDLDLKNFGAEQMVKAILKAISIGGRLTSPAANEIVEKIEKMESKITELELQCCDLSREKADLNHIIKKQIDAIAKYLKLERKLCWNCAKELKKIEKK